MTVKPSVKKRCPKCVVFHRKNRLICICPVNERHRQRQG